MGTMKIAVHQPNYLPWLGYFHKISKVDTFVFLDNVQFERRGYSHRVHVMGQRGEALWLTQSIRKKPQDSYLVEDVIFSDKHWIKKHLRTLDSIYCKTPHFKEVFRLIEQSFQSEADHLSLFNGTVIKDICASLNISTRIVYASQFNMAPFSSPSERIADITSSLGGTTYLSGSGAAAYNDPATFARYGIELAYNDFVVKPYPQRSQKFRGGLSIVDSLFNVGFDGVSAILKVSSPMIEKTNEGSLMQ